MALYLGSNKKYKLVIKGATCKMIVGKSDNITAKLGTAKLGTLVLGKE